MGVRDKLAQRQGWVAAVAVVLLLIAAGIVWISMAPASLPTTGAYMWYFDPASNTLISLPSDRETADRPELVRARVFSTGSCEDESQRLFYLEKRTNLSGTAMPGGEDERRPGSARVTPGDVSGASRVASRLVAAQDSAERWVDANSPEGRSITEFAGKVPDGAVLTECYPDVD